MHNKGFEKETFKETVRENIKTLYRKTIDEATPQQIFQAVSYAVKDVIIDDWIATQKAYDEADAKTVYYMSMEFLMGRALGNNLINLTAYKEVKEALEEMEIDLNVIEDQEPDAALGNGGLGRLAACFLDSLATLNYPAYGCGIRYRYGMFKRRLKTGIRWKCRITGSKKVIRSRSEEKNMQKKSASEGISVLKMPLRREKQNLCRKIMSLFWRFRMICLS